MRIALVTDTYTPQVNGVTTVCRRIVAVAREAGHTVAVVAPRYPRAPRPADPNELRLGSLPFPPYPSIRLAVNAGTAVSRFLDSFGPELVHVATEGPLGVAGRRWALEHDAPLVTSFHTDFPRYARYYGGALLTPLVWRWLTRFHRAARLTHTPGEAMCDQLRRRGVTSAVVWGRGVDVDAFHPGRRDTGMRRWLAGGDHTAIVLHVGRLAAEKNLTVLHRAFTLAHERLGQRAAFVIAGEGPGRRALERRLPFARFLGFLDPDTLGSLYASADFCVLPSFTETCGLVALEAMASGLPVIAADAGGLRESVHDGRNGLLAPPRDAAGFAAAIVALTSDPGQRAAMSAAARRTAESRAHKSENALLLRQYEAVAAGTRVEERECVASF